MKKLILTGIAATIAFIPAAQASPTISHKLSLDDTAEFKRGERRKGEWVRGQGPVNQGNNDGQGEREWRDDRSGQEQPVNERRRERQGGWNQSQGQSQGQTWNRGEERRQDDDDYRRRREGDWNRGDDDRRWDNRRDDNRWDDRRDGDNRRWESRRDDDRRWSDNRRYDRRDNDRWDRGWRSDRRYDWRGHRERYRSYYRPGRYYAPYRHDRYRRFSIGIYLGSPFYSNRYWITDPWYYRLPPARGPYRWVRYYDDVLLIDIRNGYVVDVIHDFFW